MNFGLIDILLIGVLFVSTSLGYRGGVLKQVLNLCVFFGTIVLAAKFIRPVGSFFVDDLLLPYPDGYIAGLLLLVGVAVIPPMMVYRVLTREKISNEVSQFFGGVLGFLEGVIFISLVLLILNLQGSPSRETREDSLLYHPVVRFVPDMLYSVKPYLPGVDELRTEVSRMFELQAITEQAPDEKEKL